MHEHTTLGLIQMSCGTEPHLNLEKAVRQIEFAAIQGAQIICLPELFQTQYFCQEQNPDWFDLAETIPGPGTEVLCNAARKSRVVVVASLFERRTPGIYHNSAVVIDADGQLLGTYRKMHIPDDPLYFEKFYFTPGDLGFRVFKTQFGNVAPLICWDQWFPEAARLVSLAGAEFLVYPTAIGWHLQEKEQWGEQQVNAWRTIQQAHAIANGVFVAAVNRVGMERPREQSPNRPAEYEGLDFWGHSFVSDPFGQLLSEAGSSEEILLVSCDPSILEQTRRNWPFFRDRRIDAYNDLVLRAIE